MRATQIADNWSAIKIIDILDLQGFHLPGGVNEPNFEGSKSMLLYFRSESL